MSNASFEEFESESRQLGFDEVLSREWEAHTELPEHTHPFSVRALVVQGELWLTVGDSTQHLCVGDRFELGHSMPHSERYGEQGATYWAARRHAA
jgi:hypothetical protein